MNRLERMSDLIDQIGGLTDDEFATVAGFIVQMAAHRRLVNKTVAAPAAVATTNMPSHDSWPVGGATR